METTIILSKFEKIKSVGYQEQFNPGYQELIRSNIPLGVEVEFKPDTTIILKSIHKQDIDAALLIIGFALGRRDSGY